MSTIPKIIEYLLQYSIETGTTLRSTSDLSPLEEWLLNKLHSTEQLNIHNVGGPASAMSGGGELLKGEAVEKTVCADDDHDIMPGPHFDYCQKCYKKF